jgi:hypothetical protein
VKSSKIVATPISNVLTSEPVRNAVGLLVNVVLVEAQKMADKKAEAKYSLERAASKSRIDELAAANAAQATTIVDLGVKQADQVFKTEAAREEAAMVGRQLAAMTEKAARAESLNKEGAAQIENWKSKWNTIRALFSENGADQEEHGIQCERPDMSPPEDERGVQSLVAPKGVCTEGYDRCQGKEADCIEAAIVLLRSAARYSKHQHSLRGGQNEPLNELRGSKSDDAVEPGISPELLFQRQNPRK